MSGRRRLLPVQRLFSMFPPGLPGLALVLMRASVAGAVLLDIYTHKATLPGWAMGAAIILSVILCAGYLTPVASVAALVFHAIVWARVGAESIAVATGGASTSPLSGVPRGRQCWNMGDLAHRPLQGVQKWQP